MVLKQLELIYIVSFGNSIFILTTKYLYVVIAVCGAMPKIKPQIIKEVLFQSDQRWVQKHIRISFKETGGETKFKAVSDIFIL